MYGGVSLAIYINGIAQELFRMVKSTAPEKAETQTVVPANLLSSTEHVYRKLSYILANRKFRDHCKTEANKDPLGFKLPDAPSGGLGDDTIETRFIVDILSGTSAGGINAIFLAKALANDQSIDQLKELWVNEGDINLLINDKKSVEDLGLVNQRPPLSLLNSRRMYLKLLRALDGMDLPNRDQKGKSRLLDDGELDLFITATDIQGLALPIRLSDSVVYERRHRNVFRFKYDPDAIQKEDQNHFVADNNPFLAFAARCTSSFPFAFEPMKLSDIDEVLNRFPEYRNNKDVRSDSKTWLKFFDSDMRRATSCLPDRPFGDGGYLDNKPFTFAADTITRRQASLPVDRKLIYIEPSPEHPELQNLELNEVDALQNVKAAILDLPTYETIRQDLERVLERNTLINRVNNITEQVDKDLGDSGLRRPILEPDEWINLDLAGMVQRFGIYYIPYRRLRIAAATDELAKSFAKLLGFDEDSAHYFAVRSLVNAWRDDTYNDKTHQTEDERLEVFAKQLANAARDNAASPEQQSRVEGMLRSWVLINFPNTVKVAAEPDAKEKASLTAEENRLKVLVQQLAKAAKAASTPQQQSDLEELLRAWVLENFPKQSENGKQPEAKQPTALPTDEVKTINRFLQDYDFKYWLRRLNFLRAKIDQLLQLDKVPFKEENTLDTTEKQKLVLDRLNTYIRPAKYENLTSDQKAEIRAVLNFLRFEVCELHKKLRRDGRRLQSPLSAEALPAEREFGEQLKNVQLDPKLVSYLLGTVDESGNDQTFSKLKPEDAAPRARRLFAESKVAAEFNAQNLLSAFSAAAEKLRLALKPIIDDAWNHCAVLLDNHESDLERLTDAQKARIKCPIPKPLSPHTKSLREYLWHYLRKFDDYDQVRFPIMYGTDGGETDAVEIFRISPEDAPSLINEREESQKPNGRLKLAGTTLHHFGAFLDRVWRQNDIMWGRLDGAERLITAMMPYPYDAHVRNALIKEAHAIILREELSTESRAQLSMLMSEALIRASSGEPIEEAIKRVTGELTDSVTGRTRLATAMTAIFDDELIKNDDEKLLTFVRLGYKVNRRLEPKAVLEIISRSTQTIGGIFENLANKNGLDGRSLAWIARLGQFFWGLVQVAVPNSILRNLATHWLKLLYLFEIVVIVGGILLARPGAQQFGWLAFGITAFLNVLKLLLTDLMRGRHVVKRVGIIIAVSLGALFLSIGVLKVAGLLGSTVRGHTPLSFLSVSLSTVLRRTGPIEPFVVPGLLIAFVIFLVIVLNAAEEIDFFSVFRRIFSIIRRAFPLKRDQFKSITLRRFKKPEVEQIHRCPDSSGNVYVIPARLSAEPPAAWASSFLAKWNEKPREQTIRIYKDTIRFTSDLHSVQSVWEELKSVIDETNSKYSNDLQNQQSHLKDRNQEETVRRARELKDRWDTLKDLN
jgi:patatin-related protein